MTQASQSGDGQKQAERVVAPLLILTTVFFIQFLSRIVLGPLLPALERDLGLTHAEAGSLFLPISVGYFVTLLLSGFISARLGHRRTIIMSGSLVGCAMLLAASVPGIWGLSVGLLLLGLAAGPYLPSGLATLTGLVRPEHWGKALAVHELAPNVSFVVAPLVAVGLLEIVSWRGALAVLGAASLIWAVVFARKGQGGHFPGQAPDLGSLGALARQPSFWIMMFLFCMGVGGSLGVYGMLPLYLVNDHGMDLDRANLLVSVSRLACMGAAFLSGWISDRMGPQRTLAVVFLSTGLFTLGLGLASGPWLLVCLFLQPATAVCFFPPAFSAIAHLGPASARSVTVSLTVPPAFMVGGGMLPAAIGWLGERSSFGLGIALFGASLILATCLVLRLHLAPPAPVASVEIKAET
ncbi:MAG: MFS transporter [Pseudomonadota bacterium]